MSSHTNWGGHEQIVVADKIYDEEPDMDDVELRCRNCGAENSLVENTMVPRSMGAGLYRDDTGRYVVNLNTGSDESFWEAEVDHKWGCHTCVAESTDINEIFEVLT